MPSRISRNLLNVRLRTFLWGILPLTFTVLIPWLIQTQVVGRPLVCERSVGQWVGAWFILDGVALAGWCVNLFNVQGWGTPMPLDPPKQFVAAGPYRVVRNPMMLGVFLVVAGEALLCQSWALGAYLLALIGLAHLFVTRWEEADLAKRFGPAYAEYRKQVPRWIPRLPARRA